MGTQTTTDPGTRVGEAAAPGARELHELSPFELKDTLIELAAEAQRTRAAVMLDAGHGNPSWVATTPREAFCLPSQFALRESRGTWSEPEVGLGGMPRSPGIARRLRDFLSSCEDGPAVRSASRTSCFAPSASGDAARWRREGSERQRALLETQDPQRVQKPFEEP
ncbi:hypothetical protein LZ198_11305 [Myxococcus sp. K15C18031901]|uniref:hypothetical protein n=1 Tax=Myxococcus dinghuensis TaxID=2906761 RepID=UPI0020A7B735|nr:hypothetical protein [Myxococcus dinghuensis]MCP3099457.1 hypothetical protein [Myxococcus dinghuensis]